MNRLRLWGLSAAVAAGVGGPAVAADPPASPPGQTTLIGKLFGPSQPKPPGPTVRSGVPTISGQLPPAVLADALRAEQDAYLRRVSVCTELRRVAVERGDDMLAKQADELERQAAALYNARVAGLGVSRVKSPLPDPSASPGLVSFDMPTSPEVAAKKLTAPAAPVPGATTAQVREVKP